MWLFGPKQPERCKLQQTRNYWRSNAKVIEWSKNDWLSLEKACENIFICGGIGSSKTTGSGEAAADGLLGLGYGGLVLTAKPDEVPRWLRRCKRRDRSHDVAVFGPGEGFNFIEYESKQGGRKVAVQNVVDVLEIAWSIADRSYAGIGSSEDNGAFWRATKRQLCSNALVLLSLGHGKTGPAEIYDLVLSAPRSFEEKNSPDWRSNSFCAHCLTQADARCRTPEDRADLELAAQFFLKEFPGLSDKTRSSIIATLTSMIDVLLRSPAREMLCGTTTVTPEFAQNGGVIIMGNSLFEHGLAAAMIQGIVKYSFQRALMRRDLRISPRPVFIYADEFQRFINQYDQEFFEACRSFRGINVCLTQNLPNLYAALGGEQRGKAQVDSILGNMNTKIMHANGDPVTNQWASALIGTAKQYHFNSSVSYDRTNPWSYGYWPAPQTTAGMSESYEFEVQPATWTRLKTGGRRNGWQAEAIVFQSGQLFADTGKTWRVATFRQRF